MERIVLDDDPVASALIAFASREEVRLKDAASFALYKFDRKQWWAWIDHLSTRANRLQPGSLVFRHLALECWEQARLLHRMVLRNRTKASYHRLRIGLKRFRYTVENFLPGLHGRWGEDLKQLQDFLGEIHDLDLLWATAVRLKVFRDQPTVDRWIPGTDVGQNIVVESMEDGAAGASECRGFGTDGNLGEGARSSTSARATRGDSGGGIVRRIVCQRASESFP